MTFQLTYLQNNMDEDSFSTTHWKFIKVEVRETCKPVKVLNIDTVLAVQTRSFFPSFENAGSEETRLLPPLIIFFFTFSSLFI